MLELMAEKVGSMAKHTIEIREGNKTLRLLMQDALDEVGIDAVVREDPPIDGEACDMLVIDYDSGLADLDEWVELYDENERPVLFLGVKRSRDRFPDREWLGRPFSRASFLSQCFDALDLEDESYSDILIPVEDDPITRELNYDEAIELEKQLGLGSGSLGAETPEHDEEDSDEEVMNIDEHGSVIIEVTDLDRNRGGQLSGSIDKRAIPREELEREREERVEPDRKRQSTFNQTMPDTPLALADGVEGQAHGMTEPAILPPPPTSEEVSDEMGPLLKSVSRMLADTWNGIGLAARTEDRAERIERVLRAAMTGGVRAASGELRRIPTSLGFAGSLESLTVIEILRTIRDRRLRGRFEIALNDATFVVFIEGGYLEDVESLSGSNELQVLDILLELEMLSQEVYGELTRGYATGSIHEPVEMKLTRERLVTEENLKIARTMQMKNSFRRMCSARQGSFSFQEIRKGDGQPWPVNGVHLPVDNILLELLRESSIDTGDSQATSRTRLVLDANRAAFIDPDSLTPDELSVLRFFRKAQNMGEALQRLDANDVNRVVNRLKKLELLKRSDPEIVIPPGLEHVREDTVVSPITDKLSREEREQQSSPANEQTTHLKEAFDVGPDTDNLGAEEVDALVEEALSEPIAGDESPENDED